MFKSDLSYVIQDAFLRRSPILLKMLSGRGGCRRSFKVGDEKLLIVGITNRQINPTLTWK